jgi:hypothetical protein
LHTAICGAVIDIDAAVIVRRAPAIALAGAHVKARGTLSLKLAVEKVGMERKEICLGITHDISIHRNAVFG